MKQKRKMVTAIRRQLHPPVSKMSRRRLCEYIYGTTQEMDVDWQPYFEHAVERKRIPKGCYSMPGPGVASYSEPKKVKAPKAKKSGKMSAYNKFVQSKMRDKSFWAKHSGTTHKQKMQRPSIGENLGMVRLMLGLVLLLQMQVCCRHKMMILPMGWKMD